MITEPYHTENAAAPVTGNCGIFRMAHRRARAARPCSGGFRLTSSEPDCNCNIRSFPLCPQALSADELKKSGVTPSADDLSGHSYL
ncbi:MAG: hypothetical protein ACFN4V_09375, partial [Prevotella denticola]